MVHFSKSYYVVFWSIGFPPGFPLTSPVPLELRCHRWWTCFADSIMVALSPLVTVDAEKWQSDIAPK